MKKILIIILAFFILNYSFVSAYSKEEIRLVYDKYFLKLDKKIDSIDQKIKSLKILDKKLEITIPKLNKYLHKQIVWDLKEINLQKISYLEKIGWNYYNKNEKQIIAWNNDNDINNTLPLLSGIKSLPNYSFLTELFNNWYKQIELSDDSEFTENNKIFRLTSYKWIKLDSSNYKYFLQNKIKDWIIFVSKDWELIISWEYEIEEKISYKSFLEKINDYIELPNSYHINNWTLYGYNFSSYSVFLDEYWVYLSDLQKWGVDISKTLFIKNKDKYYFATKFIKTKVVDISLIPDKNREEFIYNIVDDTKFISFDTTSILKDIKEITISLTEGKTESEKIKIIYDYITSQIKYYEKFIDWNKEVFSWVLTYKNNTWVCDWYTKLFLYMLSYAWIDDVKVLRWFVYDNIIFPDYWHAWVSIWNSYYDITFDDPVWDQTNYQKKFYDIPYDIFYTNRFDWFEISKDLLNLTLKERKQLRMKNLYSLYDKYKINNYKILEDIWKRIDFWINYDEEINIETLKKIFPYYTVYNNVMSDEKWNLINTYLSWYYYNLKDWTLDYSFILYLDKTKIDLFNSFLLKWYKEDGSYEYRLTSNLKFK